jgi:protease-4
MTKKKSRYWLLFIIIGIVIIAGSIGGYFIAKFLTIGTIPFGDKAIGLIKVEGPIYSSDEILNQLKICEKDKSIGAIMIKIDSPGGAVVPTEEIYKKIIEMKKKRDIPVYCSMGNIAASGGYYIASACDKVYANSGTLTGSIGVIMVFANVEELFKKIGVNMMVIKTGEYKDIGSMYREMTDAEKLLLEDVIIDVYDQFVEAVYKGRKKQFSNIIGSENKQEIISYIKEYADGRIFSGRQAKTYGFVDEIGTTKEAIDDLADEIGIKGKPEVRVYVESKSIFDFVFEDKFKEMIPESPSIEYRLR